MNAEKCPEPIETRIACMYRDSLTDYKTYLEDEQPPYDFQPDEWGIRRMGHELFITAAAKLAQHQGIGVRVNFLLEEHPHVATLSYVSGHERNRERAFLEANWKNLGKSAVNNLLLDFSESNITVAAALRANVSIKELLFGYMHLTDDWIKGIEGRHEIAKEACKSDADLYYRLVLQKHIDGYVDRGILGLMSACSRVREASKQLNIVTGNAQPDDLVRYDQEMTEDISRLNYLHMGYRTVEDLVRSGYAPLSPEEYENHLRTIFLP